MANLTAAQVKQIAKELKVKNWWNMKRADLVAAIAEIKGWTNHTPENLEFLLAGGTVTELPPAGIPPIKPPKETSALKVQEKPKRKRPTKKADKKAPAKKKTTSLPEGWVTLAQLCEEHSVEPRVARRRLRNSEAEKDNNYGWAWEAPATEIVKIITGK